METKSQPQSEFTTKDLYLAALLYARGLPFTKINRQGRVCWFVFENKNLCEQYQQQYFAKAVDVNAKEYTDALRTLKDLVFADS